MTPAEKLSAAKSSRVRRNPLGRTARGSVWVCRVRAVREEHRLSLDDVADAVGLSKQGLWQVEHGTDPQLTTARKLAAFFGKSVEELWPKLTT